MEGAARSYRDRLAERPGRFDFFALMRELERSHPDKPRIGRSEVRGQDIVTPRQEPFLTYPDSNVDRVEVHPGQPMDVWVRFMGYFGPQGALPLATTSEALYWLRDRRDPAFARFSDVFSTRFVQLFFRAWAEGRPVVQADRPDDDRFARWLGSFAGIGTPATTEADRVPDPVKLHFAGLLNSRVKSAARLRQILRRMLRLDVDIDERVAMWLEIDPSDRSSLGGPRAALGQTLCLGTRAQSINDRIRLTVHCADIPEYRRFLPGGRAARVLGDFLRFYLGDTVEVDIALTLPTRILPAVTLSGGAQLGWTSFVAPQPAAPTDPERTVCAVFSAAALRREDAPDPEAAPPVATAPPPEAKAEPEAPAADAASDRAEAPPRTVIAPMSADAEAPRPMPGKAPEPQRTVIAAMPAPMRPTTPAEPPEGEPDR